MVASLLQPLAAEPKTTVKVSRTSRAETYRPGRHIKRLGVKQPRPDTGPPVARFGGHRLRPDVTPGIGDGLADRDRWRPGDELVARLPAEVCEIRGSRADVQAHHVGTLADLGAHGRREKPTGRKIRAARGRKALVVCGPRHTAVHDGRPTRKPVSDPALEE
jgi:hypothetical protein